MTDNHNDLPLRDYQPKPMLRVPVHEVTRAAVPAIDAHNHLGTVMGAKNLPAGRELSPDGFRVVDVGALVALMDEVNVRSIVNLDGRWGAELDANLGRYDRAYPGRFATFCRMDWDQCREPGWSERLVASLRQSARQGAAGLKIEKELGLRVREEHGTLLRSDDARLDPVWHEADELNLPVLIHVGDPAAFFEPADASNERLEQLLDNPDWHFHDPSFPRLHELLDALEQTVARHPGTTFIGAHVACYPEDLQWVGRMLDSYPNLVVDIGARVPELGRQPRATRNLVLAHRSRVLFGVDEFPTRETYSIYFRFLETADEYFEHTDASGLAGMGRWAISGIDLPPDVLADVYHANASRVIPALG
jgi:predicted TIM-barrel fold metal-dependent hydrolase